MGKNTPIAAIQGDIGWSIPITHQWIAITRQWCRISNMETHRLTKKVINWSKNITINKQRNWIHKCVVFYENNNLLDISSVNNIPNVHSVLECLKTTMNIIWKNKWSDELYSENARRGTGHNKLRTYRLFKNEYGAETYVVNSLP